MHLVMELCEGGSVLDGLRDGEYSERQVAHIMRAVVRFIAQVGGCAGVKQHACMRGRWGGVGACARACARVCVCKCVCVRVSVSVRASCRAGESLSLSLSLSLKVLWPGVGSCNVLWLAVLCCAVRRLLWTHVRCSPVQTTELLLSVLHCDLK